MRLSSFKTALMTIAVATSIQAAATSAQAVATTDDGRSDMTLDEPTAIQTSKDTATIDSTVATTAYDRRIHRYRRHWNALIPTQHILQFCGNMGVVSAGIGWDYGRRRQWETQLLFGYVPKYDSRNAKITMTLKQNYIPWSIYIKDGWSIEPLQCGLYLNTVFGHDF